MLRGQGTAGCTWTEKWDGHSSSALTMYLPCTYCTTPYVLHGLCTACVPYVLLCFQALYSAGRDEISEGIVKQLNEKLNPRGIEIEQALLRKV